MKTEFAPRTTPEQRQAVLDFARQARETKGDRILKIILIGSVARGDFGPGSDVDVVLVADSADADFKCDVWDIGAQVSLANGVILNVHIYSRARWDQMKHDKAAVWRDIERDGIDLMPEPIPA